LIQLSWVVFLHAVLLSTESIMIEVLTTQLQLRPLVVAASSISMAGAVLLVITFHFERKKKFYLVFQSWKYLVPGSLLIAGGVFAWYDSVDRVGASKEGLVAGPLETVAVLFLARAFLQEKLNRLQMVGVLIAITGFFATVMSAGSRQPIMTVGDIEAIFSALSFGSGIVFVAKMTKSHSALAVTAATLFGSGVVLAAILWASNLPSTMLSDWMILLLFSFIPLSAALTYILGLARIGASLTSTIGSFSILLTVVFQLILFSVGVQVNLPSSIPLAVVGGALGVFGIYLIHRTDMTKIQAR
jgi:drug/metabolite transporter (DMT)-like permease